MNHSIFSTTIVNIYLFSFRGEHLAVRNAEGSFYLCQTMQHIYKSSKKIRIQWLSEKPDPNPKMELYVPEYYDQTGKHITRKKQTISL